MAHGRTVVHAIHRGNAKVRSLDVHPSMPWVAAADECDSVIVFDWQCGRMLQEIGSGVGGVEESRAQVGPLGFL
jgi:hypothetical protein